MKQFQTADSLANDARMRRAVFTGAFLFVEGESDERVYRTFIDPGCQIIIASSRSNVIGACGILTTTNFLGAIGIIDADFDHLDAVPSPWPNVFQTDFHDVECSILSTQAFDRLLVEFGDSGRIDTWQQVHARNARDHILQQASTVGYLLWHSNREGINLKFSTLDFGAFVDPATLDLSSAQLVQEVKNKSSRHDLRSEDLEEAIRIRRLASSDFWQVCCGHHFASLLTLAFRHTFARHPALEVSPERLERYLRVAYPEIEFRATNLFQRIQAWVAANPPFRIFR